MLELVGDHASANLSPAGRVSALAGFAPTLRGNGSTLRRGVWIVRGVVCDLGVQVYFLDRRRAGFVVGILWGLT